jgi:membrane associated rhomboid family serine protease
MDLEAAITTVQNKNKQKWIPWHTFGMIVLYVILFYNIKKGSDDYNLLAFRSTETKDVYTWWTYSLLHFNEYHLYGNMMVLLASGGLLEYGNEVWRTTVIYNLSILGGVCGCGWSLRFIPRDPTSLVGASGGIYGLLAAQIGYLMMNWPELSIPVRVMNTGLLVSSTSSDIILSCINPNAKVSYSTHFGGFLTGAMASVCFVHNIKPLRWEKIAKITTGCVLGGVLIAGFVNLLTL